MHHEAKIEETEHGRVPVDDGWYILNLSDIGWATVAGGGTWCGFGSPNVRSDRIGIGVHILWPGDSPGFYHEESDLEGFLVLSGECIAVVEGEERRMGPWDYLHSPPGTRHITVGAGDGPCAILMYGTRTPGSTILYPVEPAAAKHGHSVETETDSPKEAYKDRPPIEQVRSPWPLA
jgi:uncharacterized cupin superfamily protein